MQPHIDRDGIRQAAASLLPGDSFEPVIIKIEIDRMRSQLYHMVDAQMSGVNDKLKRAVDLAISEFNFEGQFFNTVQDSVRREIERRTNELISEVMKETFNHAPFREKVAKMIVRKISK